MTRTILLLLLAACGGGEDAHDVIDCGRDPVKCELACSVPYTAGVDMNGDGQDDKCRPSCSVDFVADFDGQRGCCVIEARDKAIVVAFVECEP